MLRSAFGNWDACDPVAHCILDLVEAQHELADLFVDDAEYGIENEAAFTAAVKKRHAAGEKLSRRHRQRRRRGTRCITVDVNEGEIAALVARGYLPEEARDDPVAIKAAIEVVDFDELFGLCAASSRRNPNNARRHRRTFTRGAR